MARIARSLDRLRAQVRASVPQGPPLEEYGWLGDAAHQGRTSDHNPDELGIVRALDIPHDPAHGLDSYELANHLRDTADPRIKYLISNRRIWNPAISKAWRVYTGTNPHTEHMHVSAVKGTLADDARDWDLGEILSGEPEPEDAVTRPMLQRGSVGEDVRQIQQMLMVDGIFGHLTEEAIRIFQESEGLDGDGIVGPLTWRALQYRHGAPPTPEPVPEPPPVDALQTNITATVFGGASEVERSAYDNHVVGETELAVALPFRFKGPRPKVAVAANGKTIVASIEDVGPWLTDDPYWQTGKRPIAESKDPLPRGPNKGKVSNGAGIDLSPAAARAIGIDGKGVVNWKFIS
jgi:peptidoglycan hydrolase-like protein with peptidoglycan-binding domain